MFIFAYSVIGRGGQQINKLQSETGAKIQVAPRPASTDVCGYNFDKMKKNPCTCINLGKSWKQ